MQAVINNPAALGRIHFAGGRSYMMRSEKRSGSDPSHRAPAGGGRPPRRRRKRAGFFYILLMLILLLSIWPLGLLMLWQRKVRWGALTKLLTSIVTLAACVILIGFALTVTTDNVQYTAVQDSVNNFLDTAADTMIDAGGIIAENASLVYERAGDMADALLTGGKVYLSDAIDAGVVLAQQTKSNVQEIIEKYSRSDDAADAPEASEGDSSEDAPLSEATPEITEEPASHTLEPTATPEPTAEPTPKPLVFTIKSAADAIVYYNDGGKCYHMASACGSMTSAVEHTFGETRDVSNHRCSICGTPEKSLLDEEHIVWLDEGGIAHLSDECTSFTGGWKLIPAAQANENGNTGCDECSADLYLRAVAAELDVIIEEPTPEPTATPEPTITPEPTEKPTEEPTAEPTAAPTEAPSEAPGAEAAAISEEATEEPAADPTAEPTEEPTEEPTQEPTVEPLADPTEEPTAQPTEEPTAEPTAQPTPVPTEEPTEAPTQEPTAAPTKEPTPQPTEQPTPEPTSQPTKPAATLKPAALATVYHSSNGKWYHTHNRCSGMTGGDAYTLEECVENFKCCNACGAPKPELIGQDCLWMDESNTCHTSDECSAFQGQYKLVQLDSALALGYAACQQCDADSYLTPVTQVNVTEIIMVTEPAA